MDGVFLGSKGSRRTVLILLAVVMIFALGIWYMLRPKGTVAPDFSLVDLEGNTFRLSEIRGKVVVIDFMATWCGPCLLQISEYKAVWGEFKDEIVLISIDIDPGESEDILRAFIQQFTYATWTWARGTANLAEAYEVAYIPKTVIIDQEGHIRYSHVGVTSASALIQEIEDLLG